MKKEKYYSENTITEKACELLENAVVSQRHHTGFTFRPEKAALLVLDLQEYFLSENSHAFIPSAPAIVPGISALTDSFIAAKRPVVATRHVNTPENAGMMSKWWRELISPSTAYSHYSESLNTQKTIQLSKSQYDAFLHTSLESILHDHLVEQIVITGVMTHLCCETTARSAFMRGFEVFFTIDGTATYNEELHRASLLTLAHGFAVPVLVGELLNEMDAHAK